MMVDNGKLREAQLRELELLKTFRDICDAEGIRYYLLGGTAIGAVRHKGFIPWDDDIDVALMREDYDRFPAVAAKYLEQGQKILHYTLDPSYRDYTMKLVDAHTFFLTQQETTILKNNIWIDIFPIDGSPNASFVRWLHFRRLDMIRMRLAFRYIDEVRIDENRSGWRKALIAFAQKVPVGRLIDPSRTKRALDREFRRWKIDGSRLIGNYMGAYHEVEFFPPETFGEGTEVTFEGETFTAPKLLDAYLTHQYGDYMQLPPDDKQAPKHYVLDVIHEED